MKEFSINFLEVVRRKMSHICSKGFSDGLSLENLLKTGFGSTKDDYRSHQLVFLSVRLHYVQLLGSFPHCVCRPYLELENYPDIALLAKYGFRIQIPSHGPEPGFFIT